VFFKDTVSCWPLNQLWATGKVKWLGSKTKSVCQHTDSPVLSRESKLTVYNWLTVKTERQSKQASSSRRAAQDQRILGVKQAMATQLGRREERNQLKKTNKEGYSWVHMNKNNKLGIRCIN